MTGITGKIQAQANGDLRNTEIGRLHIGEDEYILHPNKLGNFLEMQGGLARLKFSKTDMKKLIIVFNTYFLNDEYLAEKFGTPKRIPDPKSQTNQCECGGRLTKCSCGNYN